MNEIELVLTMDRRTARELAQFAKRLGFQACYDLTEAHLPHEERIDKAYLMIHGMDLVARALSGAGFAPR
ncbi:DUF7706 family protein [Duganella vulcania]|uniref:Uncharacterized protein n=1 Tax=Duganella vulcania TaxID=2692166 RepID=A0A845GMW2_9BURK|nr:hypothetical protein [Duganella vulcania]MYM95903.1 hypothetical protein [Duganella vulcania]